MKKRNNYYTWCVLLTVCLSTSCDEPHKPSKIADKQSSSINRIQVIHSANRSSPHLANFASRAAIQFRTYAVL